MSWAVGRGRGGWKALTPRLPLREPAERGRTVVVFSDVSSDGDALALTPCPSPDFAGGGAGSWCFRVAVLGAGPL
jgi:hypothetical protein